MLSVNAPEALAAFDGRDIDRQISGKDLIAINHALEPKEIAYLIEQGRSVASIARFIEQVLLPSFEESEVSIRKPDSAEFWRAFALERRLHAFFTCSYLFEEAAREYLERPGTAAVRERLYSALGRMVLWNELTSARHITNVLRVCSAKERLEFFGRMVRPYTDFRSQLLNMERIPQIESEILQGGVKEDSSVLMIGCGPLPLSGIAYAMACEKVVIVDRVAEAFTAAEPVLSLLPYCIQDRITMVAADARSFTELPETSHMLVAGLTEGKDQLLNLAAQADTSYTVMLRTPPGNLLELYYYPLENKQPAGFFHDDTVAIGVEGYNNTLILKTIKSSGE